MRLPRRALSLAVSVSLLAACSKSSSSPGAHYTLTAEAVPVDGGEISLTPAAPAEGYAAETTVEVSVRAYGGWQFDQWEGDLSGTATKATVAMDGARTIRALFKVQVIDNIAPRLVSMSPANQATCVAATRALTLEFSEPMQAEATNAAVGITPAVDGDFSWNAEGTRLSFTPRAPWAASQRYDVAIGGGAADLAGNTLDGAPHVLTFVAASGADQPGSLGCFASWLTGAYSNDRQYKTSLETPGSAVVKNVRLRMRRCWGTAVPDAQGYWAYVEQAVAYGSGETDEWAPYRQRVYHLAKVGEGTCQSTIYAFKDRPTEIAPGDFRDQITDRITDASDRAWVETVYENDGDRVRLVGMSRHYDAALEVIVAVLQQYEGTANPTVPTQLTAAELQSRILAHIDDALLDSLDDSRYHLGDLDTLQGQALVSSMYADDPREAQEQLLRTQFEELDPQRLRTVLNGVGYNGGHNHNPRDYAGDWTKAQPLADLGPDDFEKMDGCEVTLDWNGSAAFAGATLPKACRNTEGGAAYANSEVMLREASMVSWDRGFDVNDQQVWGGDERYEFDKAFNFVLQ